MIRIFVLALISGGVFVSCVSHDSNESYQPTTRPEKIEFANDRLDVYPDDVRKDPASHTNAAVVWVGIIRSTDAYDQDSGNKIMADTVFEHHYFDWVEDGHGGGARLSISPRGEGLFRAKWCLDKTIMDASTRNAERFAGKGKLAIFYGVPQTVETNGTVVLKYRYLRIFDREHYTTNEFDYGRLGDHLCPLHPGCKTNSTAVQAIRG